MLLLSAKYSGSFYLMGINQMKDVMENLLKDQTFRLVHRSNITLFLRQTFQDYINLVQKSCHENSFQSRLNQFGENVLPETFLGYALYAGGIWKGDISVADIEELEEIGR